FRLRNVLWDKYYAPTLQPTTTTSMPASNSEFHAVYDDVKWRDAFYRFLQNVYRIFPEDRFHTLIKQACDANREDEAIYRAVQQGLPGIKPFLAELFYALP